MARGKAHALLLAAILAGLTTACGSPGAAPFGTGCMPPSFSLDAESARAGGPITVSAPDATCDPRYGGDAQIQVEVMDGSGSKVMETLAAMNDAGGFSLTVNLPETAVPGEGAVVAYPFGVDWCDDTGRNNRLSTPAGVGTTAEVGIQRVSCVMPTQPLLIEP